MAWSSRAALGGLVGASEVQAAELLVALDVVNEIAVPSPPTEIASAHVVSMIADNIRKSREETG